MIRTRARASIVIVLLLFTGHGLGAQQISGRVVAVADGDTLTVLDASKQQHRVRLNGIDAPEAGQAFFATAKEYLATLALGQPVVVVASGRDAYGRVVGTVLAGTMNVNLEQVKAGLAWYYREYAADVARENRALYEAAENEARVGRAGLWRDARPVAPWTFRGATRPPATPTTARPITASRATVTGHVIANRNSGIYHVPGCQSYNAVAERNRVYFDTEPEAVAAGYRKARNCR